VDHPFESPVTKRWLPGRAAPAAVLAATEGVDIVAVRTPIPF
jgi:hypothetical protein